MLSYEDNETLDDHHKINNEESRSLKCPQCHKGIPQRVFSIHKAMCCPETPPNTGTIDLEDSTASLVPAVLEGPEVSPVSEVNTFSKLSLKERERQLQKFELLLLSDESVEEFNKLFVERQLDISERPSQS